ncbi:uncharacterized protein G2W53_042619 [Senna tora]|uniref:Uncharacterized protein n=1 Tax=Senna tora TaxID=362788 RepID=A0A834VZ47_9FABA|nr:uncharacterized protein G2W53_042619 [Senna tora]
MAKKGYGSAFYLKEDDDGWWHIYGTLVPKA